jgi:exosortase/archaeosortase family protein
MVRFALTFGLLAVTLLGLYYFPYPDGGVVKPCIDGFLHCYAVVASVFIRLLEPGVQVVRSDIIGRFPMRIVRTCDAMDVQILVASALLAWPAPWPRRLVSIVVSAVILCAVNVARICSLYFVGVRFPAYFEVAHLEVWPALILVTAVALFFAMTAWSNRQPPTVQDPHA